MGFDQNMTSLHYKTTKMLISVPSTFKNQTVFRTPRENLN